MIDINDLQIEDDLNVDPETYPDRETTPRPPLPGNYSFKPAKWQLRTDKTGQLVLWKDRNGNPKYPVISLTTVDITDPSDFSRSVVLFQDIPTYPFEREGKLASQAADVLRALDNTATAANTGEVLRQVSDRLNAQMEFKARLDYTAYDSAYAKELLAALPEGATKKDTNACYEKARIRGYKRIQKANAAAGKADLPLTKWAGPSGAVVDVKPTLTVFFESGETVNLGPDKGLVA